MQSDLLSPSATHSGGATSSIATRFLCRVLGWLDSGWPSAIAVGILIWIFGIFFKFPYNLLTDNFQPRLADFLKLCIDPFARDLAESILAYRISVPLIAWALHIPLALCPYLQIGFLMGTYAVLYRLIARRTSSVFYALVVVAGLSQTFLAHWTNRWVDPGVSFAYFCGALALLSRNSLWLVAMCIFAIMSDERGIFMLSFIVYWHGSRRATQDVFDWPAAVRSGIALAVGLVGVLLLRHAMTVGWIGPGITKPQLYSFYAGLTYRDLHPLNSTWVLYSINVLTTFTWYWIPIAIVAYRQLHSAVPITGVLLVAGILAGTAAAMMAYDVSKSTAYIYPIVAIAAVLSYDQTRQTSLRLWGYLLLANTLTPTIYYTTTSGGAFIPFPIELGNHLLQMQGIDALHFLKITFFRVHA